MNETGLPDPNKRSAVDDALRSLQGVGIDSDMALKFIDTGLHGWSQMSPDPKCRDASIKLHRTLFLDPTAKMTRRPTGEQAKQCYSTGFPFVKGEAPFVPIYTVDGVATPADCQAHCTLSRTCANFTHIAFGGQCYFWGALGDTELSVDASQLMDVLPDKYVAGTNALSYANMGYCVKDTSTSTYQGARKLSDGGVTSAEGCLAWCKGQAGAKGCEWVGSECYVFDADAQPAALSGEWEAKEGNCMAASIDGIRHGSLAEAKIACLTTKACMAIYLYESQDGQREEFMIRKSCSELSPLPAWCRDGQGCYLRRGGTTYMRPALHQPSKEEDCKQRVWYFPGKFARFTGGGWVAVAVASFPFSG